MLKAALLVERAAYMFHFFHCCKAKLWLCAVHRCPLQAHGEEHTAALDCAAALARCLQAQQLPETSAEEQELLWQVSALWTIADWAAVYSVSLSSRLIIYYCEYG